MRSFTVTVTPAILCASGFTRPTSSTGARLSPNIEMMDPGATVEFGVSPTAFFTPAGAMNGTLSVRAITPCGDDIITTPTGRSEEHTSELQSQSNLVCRLLLEK